MSAVPAEVVDAKTGDEEPFVVHGVNVPASGPHNNVHPLPKEFDDKVAKMHLSSLGAELVALIVDVSPAGTSPKAVCGASCERFLGVSKTGALVSGSTGNHEGPTGPVHRQDRRCDSVLQHQVHSLRTVYFQTAQKTVEVVSATEFNVPEGQSRSMKFGSLTELLRYLLYCRGLPGANSAPTSLFWRE